MDRTLIAVRNMLTALDAPAYDIGILSDRGMLPGLSDHPADFVMSRLPLLKAHNSRGAHIYIRPSGAHRFTVLDDLNQSSIDRLTADDFEPCAVVETSAGNFQAWLKHDDVYPTDLSTFIAQTLASKYQGERRRLAAFRQASRFHKLQAKISQGQRSLSIRTVAELHWQSIPDGVARSY
jgi:hypothetical protein